MVEKHPDYTPYSFVYNNPVRYFDPLGLDTAFVSQSDRDFVLDLINPQSLNYSKEYAGKFQDLVDSKTMYKFKSYKAGTKHNGQSGKTYVDANNPNQINIDFTMGDDPVTRDLTMGRSKFGVLFEETYHAWYHATGGLNFSNATCLNEANAWQFASIAPGTLSYMYGYKDNKIFRDVTVMGRIRETSVDLLAIQFKCGMPQTFNPIINSISRAINAKGEPMDRPSRGLYHDLPVKYFLL